ncbi:hypothetical protein [Profundibacter amoris]|uniref:Uncharacterized protein n=1 Tax=Profundibacter amoris TaxID=2171755 RepID=A0A347UF96_9RHOB|nr:hypothetical protein [Profundibacter amoris]AXX97524.1 hypothetical protein BAR1_05985 [Profundibacter amoris]
MLKFLNGGYGLAKTFWIGVFGVGIVFKIAFKFITKGYLAARNDLDIARVEMFHHVLLILLCIYVLLMVRAMIKAGFNDRRPGVWGWMGIGLTIFAAALNINIASKTFFPSRATSRVMLEIGMRQLNTQLPQDMGNGMTMIRAEISGDDVIYYIDAEGEIDAVVTNIMEKSLLDMPVGQKACTALQGSFKGGINSIIYDFSFDNGNAQQVIKGADCLAWLAQQ